MDEAIRVYDWQEFAERLLAAEGNTAAQRGGPTLVRIYEDPDGDGIWEIQSLDPRFLIGWVAPRECIAVGLVATGRAYVIDDDGPDADAVERDLAHLQMCCVVGRSGEIGWKMTGSDGSASVAAPTEGKLLDALKRCFGLPTTPPGAPAAELHAAAWAASVFEKAIGSPDPLTWSEVERLHPLARLLAGELSDDPEHPETRAGDLADLVRIAANAWSWKEIRAQACDGNLEALIEPGMAAWMDDGMFSRWLMERVVPLDQMLSALRCHLVPSAFNRLAATLR